MPIVNVARVAVEFIFKTNPQGALQAEKLNKRVENSAKKANGLIGQLGGSLFGLGAATFYTGLKMDDTLVKMTTQLRLTRNETELLRPKFREIAEEWGQSAERIAEGYYLAVSSGATLAGAMDIVQKSAKLAAGQFGDIEQIASTLTSAQVVFKEPAERAADYFAKAIEIGKIPQVREYGAAMARLFGPARTLGVELSEINAMAARLSRIGLPIQEAVTQIGEWMVSVIKPSRQAAEMLGQVGLTMDDVRRAVKERGFVQAFEDLRSVYGMNTEQLGKMLGRQTALKALLVSTGQYWEETKWIIDEVTDSVGHSEEKARIAQESYGVGLRSALQATVNELDSLFVSLSFIIRAFLALPDPIKTAIIALGAFVVMGGVFGHALGIGGAVGIVRMLIASFVTLGRIIRLNTLYVKHGIFWEIMLNKHRSLSFMWNTLLVGSTHRVQRAMHSLNITRRIAIADYKIYSIASRQGYLMQVIEAKQIGVHAFLRRVEAWHINRSTSATVLNTTAVKQATIMQTLQTRLMKTGLLIQLRAWFVATMLVSISLVVKLIPALAVATGAIKTFTLALARNPFTLLLVGIAAVTVAAGGFFGMFGAGMDKIHNLSQRKISFQSDAGIATDEQGNPVDLVKVRAWGKNFWNKGGEPFQVPKENLELYKKLWENMGKVSRYQKLKLPFYDRPWTSKEFVDFVKTKEEQLLAKTTPISGKQLYDTGVTYNRVQEPTSNVSNSQIDRSTNLSMDNLTIQTQASTPEGIAEAVETMMKEQLENVKQNVDDDVAY